MEATYVGTAGAATITSSGCPGAGNPAGLGLLAQPGPLQTMQATIIELAGKLAAALRQANTCDNRRNAAFVAGVVRAVAQINDYAEPIVAEIGRAHV